MPKKVKGKSTKKQGQAKPEWKAEIQREIKNLKKDYSESDGEGNLKSQS